MRSDDRTESAADRAARAASSDVPARRDLARIEVKGSGGQLVPLAELGHWETTRVDQMIYHKKPQRVAYVFAETAGRPPADVVVDVLADRVPSTRSQARRASCAGSRRGPWIDGLGLRPRPVRASGRSSTTAAASPGGCRTGFTVDFAGEGEWKITLDVFRDLGLAFAAAMIGIYVLLVAQMRSFAIPWSSCWRFR